MTTPTEFFSKLVKEYKPNISATTVASYTSNLRVLLPNVSTLDQLKQATSMTDIKSIIKHIETAYGSPSSRGVKFNSLIIIVKGLYSQTDPRYVLLSEKRDACNGKYTQNAEKGELSTEQRKNFVSTDEYQQMLKDWKPRIAELMTKTDLKRSEFNEIVAYYIADVYFYQAFRSDLDDMYVSFSKSQPKDEEHNYLWINGKKVKVIQNHFKTERTYGQNVVDISTPLSTDLIEYARFLQKHHQDKKQPLIAFPERLGQKPLNSNQLTILFSSIFLQRLGKKYTIVLNRKRVASSNPAVQKLKDAQEEVQKLAKDMGTSQQMITKIYDKKNAK